MSDVMTQDFALDVMASGQNAFVTGPPGTGKSWVLRKFVTAARREQSVAVTASTGVAATQIGGTTLHAWAGLGAREEYTAKDIATIADNNRVANRVRNTEVLVIDEVSMLQVGTFEAADAVCRKVKRSTAPFGGMQVVLCGDFFQLPPVAKGRQAPFIYGCVTWNSLGLAALYLTEQHRQTDDALLGILTAMRSGELVEHHLEQLQSRMHAELADGMVPTRLQTHNDGVDRVNVAELSALRTKSVVRVMTTDGPEPVIKALQNSCLAPVELELKEGASVMFVKNNISEGYANGTMGKVVGFDNDLPRVKTLRHGEIVVQPQEWATEDGKGRKIASVAQVPLRLAWAISIHKSQGMSLTAAEIDLSRAFVAGLGYVALSRVTALEGIRLLGLNRQALMVSELAMEIDRELQALSNDVLAGVATAAATAADAGPQSEAMSLF